MSYILLTSPDDDGIVIKTMDKNALSKHIEEKNKEGIQYRFLDRIPEIRNGIFLCTPLYTDEDLKGPWPSRADISFAVVIKGDIIVPD